MSTYPMSTLEFRVEAPVQTGEGIDAGKCSDVQAQASQRQVAPNLSPKPASGGFCINQIFPAL